MAYENYTVQQFYDAWFKDDRSIMDEETFIQVHTEYVDTSQLYDVDEFDKVAYINFLNNRINKCSVAILLQKKFILDFDIPYIPAFKTFENLGYFLSWNKDFVNFIEQLNSVEEQEKKFISKLENCIKELEDERKAKQNSASGEESSPKQNRQSFVRTINTLGKLGYQIRRNETTVEEFSLMIVQEKEAAAVNSKPEPQWPTF